MLGSPSANDYYGLQEIVDPNNLSILRRAREKPGVNYVEFLKSARAEMLSNEEETIRDLEMVSDLL